jgi:hypothetical protein
MKFVTFIAAPDGQDYRAFQDWFAEDHIPAVVARSPNFRGGVFRRRVPSPVKELNPPPGEPTKEIAPSDIMMEVWLPSTEDFRREVMQTEKRLRAVKARYISYAVSPRLVKDGRITEAGPSGRRPEITYVCSMKWAPHISADYGWQEYEAHAPIAIRTQPAISRYEQNLVQDVISWTPDTPPIDVYADFSFRALADVAKSFHITEEEWQDVSRFMGAATTACFSDVEPFGFAP